MYHMATYFPGENDAPRVRLSGPNRDIPVLEVEGGDIGSGVTFQFSMRTAEGADNTVGWLRAVSREALRLVEMVDRARAEQAEREAEHEAGVPG